MVKLTALRLDATGETDRLERERDLDFRAAAVGLTFLVLAAAVLRRLLDENGRN